MLNAFIRLVKMAPTERENNAHDDQAAGQHEHHTSLLFTKKVYTKKRFGFLRLRHIQRR